jgi:hypothetical protein
LIARDFGRFPQIDMPAFHHIQLRAETHQYRPRRSAI